MTVPRASGLVTVPLFGKAYIIVRGNWFYGINSLLLTVSYKCEFKTNSVRLIVRHITSWGRIEDFAKRPGPRLKVAMKSRGKYKKKIQTITDDGVHENAQKLIEIRQMQTISSEFGTAT